MNDATPFSFGTSHSELLRPEGICWDDVPRHPLPAEAIRTLQYMQDTESHTIIYLRDLLSTRAVDDTTIAAFFACWFYEESLHGRSLARFLTASGHEPLLRRRSQFRLQQRVHKWGVTLGSQLWPNFVAVHMTWGAINELTTLTAYGRLAELTDHPVLAEILQRIQRDEARHFRFYFETAERCLAGSSAARAVTGRIIGRFWEPVGSGVQPDAETRFVADYLFTGAEGRAAAQRIDRTMRRLPGLDGVDLLEAWIDRSVRPS